AGYGNQRQSIQPDGRLGQVQLPGSYGTDKQKFECLALGELREAPAQEDRSFDDAGRQQGIAGAGGAAVRMAVGPGEASGEEHEMNRDRLPKGALSAWADGCETEEGAEHDA